MSGGRASPAPYPSEAHYLGYSHVQGAVSHGGKTFLSSSEPAGGAGVLVVTAPGGPATLLGDEALRYARNMRARLWPLCVVILLAACRAPAQFSTTLPDGRGELAVVALVETDPAGTWRSMAHTQLFLVGSGMSLRESADPAVTLRLVAFLYDADELAAAIAPGLGPAQLAAAFSVEAALGGRALPAAGRSCFVSEAFGPEDDTAVPLRDAATEALLGVIEDVVAGQLMLVPVADAGVADSGVAESGMDSGGDSGSDSGAGRPDSGPPCEPPWWDTDYAFRRPLTINESVAGSLAAGYTVAVEDLDTASLVNAGTILPTGDDLRIVREAVGDPLELHRRVRGMGSSHTDIHFKTVSEINGLDGTYYLYYGNALATAPPAHWSDCMGAEVIPSAVYLAGDDFEQDAPGDLPSGWVGSSAFAIELDGANHVLASNLNSPEARNLFAGDLAWTDVAVEAQFRILGTGGRYWGIFARVDGETDFDTLFFGYHQRDAMETWICNYEDPFALVSTCTPQLNGWTVSPAGTAWHALEMRVLGDSAEYYLDGAPMGTDTLPSDRVTHGRIGCCGGYDDAYVQWDDIVVRPYVSPEPTVVVGPEEARCF